jgi:rubredoxin
MINYWDCPSCGQEGNLGDMCIMCGYTITPGQQDELYEEEYEEPK